MDSLFYIVIITKIKGANVSIMASFYEGTHLRINYL
jgi:hypothetical protein